MTDTPKSYGAAKREILPGVERRQHKGLNHQAELSHPPTREKRAWFNQAKQEGNTVLGSQ
jgi:putative transposase